MDPGWSNFPREELHVRKQKIIQELRATHFPKIWKLNVELWTKEGHPIPPEEHCRGFFMIGVTAALDEVLDKKWPSMADLGF
jgi:hypothetical protein